MLWGQSGIKSISSLTHAKHYTMLPKLAAPEAADEGLICNELL